VFTGKGIFDCSSAGMARVTM